MTGDPDDLLTIDEVITILRVSRTAFYRWRRRGTGPPSVRLPSGAVQFPRGRWPDGCAACTRTPRKMRAPQPEQLRRESLGPPQDRRHRQRPLAGPVGRRRPRALQILRRPAPRRSGFAAALKDAIRDRRPFNQNTGLPAQPGHAAAPCTWYDHARAYTSMKWPQLAPTSRRSIAEALPPSPRH